MNSLIDLPAKRCLTAAGMLIYQKKVLLIKHRKLGIWFCPGGHVDANELPHQAAEREFVEETGVMTLAFDPFYQHQGTESEYLPSPVESNLHWVCEENYQLRINSPEDFKPVAQWSRGCEQHLALVYMMKLADENNLNLSVNKRESTDIGWFSLEEVANLKSPDDIKEQIRHGFEIMENWKG